MSSSPEPTAEVAFAPHLRADVGVATRAAQWLARADSAGVVRRLWQKDFTIWREEPTEISNRLGWLTVVDTMRARAPEIQKSARSLKDAGITDVVLLGMGGSSLAPEVFRRTFGSAPGFPTLHVLDTTSPHWIRRVTSQLDAGKLHVLLASKSGSTIEVRTLFAHFEKFLRGAGIAKIGDHFSAITDPGTALDALSREREFRHSFLNPADIGGRYSALSLFGLVPAALVGLPVSDMLDTAAAMMASCRDESRANPGLQLGVFLGASARHGRDKLTMITSPGLSSFGLWIEQLVAESTGKEGTGIVPVVGEPFAPVDRLGSDRVFVATRCGDEDNAKLDARIRALEAAGQPVYSIDVPNVHALPAEMFRWEFATAVAGYVLGIQPFDQPDVQAAKSQATKILDSLAAGKTPPAVETRHAREFLELVVRGDYVGFMVYGDPTDEYLDAMDELRVAVTKRFGVATTLGIGPRFLHSTGQLHKGGAANGVFPQVVLAEEDLAIPGETFGFRQLMEAQAAGDLTALRASGRRAARVDLPDAAAVRALIRALA